MNRPFAFLVALIAAASLMVAGCTQAAPAPTPTKAPAAPTKAPEPTKPAAPAAAPTKAAEPTKAAPVPTAAPTAVPAKKVDFPAGKPVSIIVPWSAGATDTMSRILAAQLEKELKTSFPVVNKPGASTQVGASELAAAKPDGYTTLVVSITSTLTTYLDPERKAPYTRASFQPIAVFTFDPGVIAVRVDGPYKELKDLIDAAKAKPDQVKIATSGLMAHPHLASAMMGKTAGVKFAFVHFDSGGAASTAALGGHADALTTTIGSVMPFVRNNQLRVLGVMDKEASAFLPGVKTFNEQGYKIESAATSGLVAPAGTPKEIVDILQNATKAALGNDDVKKRLTEAGISIKYMDQQQFAAYWAEMEPWTKQAMEAGKQ